MANSHVCVGFHCEINVIPAKVPYDFILFRSRFILFVKKGMTVTHCYMLNHTCVWKRYDCHTFFGAESYFFLEKV